MRTFILLVVAAIVIASCNSEYGNKVTINKQSEVYYKGKGVTEEDAKRLGDFLLQQGYFDSVTNKSVQLTKDTATWIVKLVVDKDKVDLSDPTIKMSAQILGLVIAETVFNKEKTEVILVDENMEEIKAPATKEPAVDTTGKAK